MFGLASCSNENDVTHETGTAGSTSARVTVSIATTNGFRAQPQTDETGRNEEQTIATMHLLGFVNKDWNPSATDGDGFWETATKGTYTIAPFETKAGSGMLAMALNKGDVDVTPVAISTFGAKSSAIDDIAKLSTDGKFLMTSSVDNKTVTEDITEAQAKSGSTEDENVFKFELERVVAQAFVSKKDALSGDVEDKSGKVDLTDMTYSVMNGASKTYLLRNNAGERTMNDEGKYEGFESAIHNKTVAEAMNPDQDFLIRIGNLLTDPATQTNDDLGGYKAVAVNDASYQKGGNETNRGIYFLENSFNGDLTKVANRQDGYARLATVKVYATFTPTVVYGLKDDAKAEFVPATGSKVWYKERTVTKTTDNGDGTSTKDETITYSERTISDDKPTGALVEETTTDGNVTTVTKEVWREGRAKYNKDDVEKLATALTPGTTFYIGSTDGVAYNSIEAAFAAGNEKVQTYMNGRSGYYALINRTTDTDVKYADTRRNNIYALSIASFSSRGFNWDPNDPNDPNLPKPDPKDPDQDPDPDHHTNDIEPKTGFMRVEAEVLPWNLVERDIHL
ncbi:MAG: fimbria major subunit [Fermentimonas sp.]|jgi:hypothetical protein